MDKSPIPLNTWLLHKHSENVFKVTKIHLYFCETIELSGNDRRKGFANRDILESSIRAGEYYIDTVKV